MVTGSLLILTTMGALIVHGQMGPASESPDREQDLAQAARSPLSEPVRPAPSKTSPSADAPPDGPDTGTSRSADPTVEASPAGSLRSEAPETTPAPEPDESSGPGPGGSALEPDPGEEPGPGPDPGEEPGGSDPRHLRWTPPPEPGPLCRRGFGVSAARTPRSALATPLAV
jgi:hypothetical protein